MRIILIMCFITFIFSAQAQKINDNTSDSAKYSKEKNSESVNFIFKIIPSINGTWGYDILKGNKLFIHQTSIPAVSGNEGFKTKADAEKVARLVISKLKKGEMPPSLTKEELKNLKVISTTK
jgi:hypothetical protein